MKSGHGCLGCAEEDFWDKGSFYSAVTNFGVMGGAEANADRIGGLLAGAAAVGVAAHAAVSVVSHMTGSKSKEASHD